MVRILGVNWIQRLLRRDRLEKQLDKEVRFHLEQYTADLVARGVDPAEARRQAHVAFGGAETVKEECRDARGTRWLEDLVQDCRYAFRMLALQPAFAAVALLTLALGTGATTVMFTVINGVLLKPVALPDPDRLVALHGRSEGWNVGLFGEQNLANPDFRDLQRGCRSVSIVGWVFNGGTVSEPGEPEYIDLREASADFFSVLGIRLARGRSFSPDEDRAGGPPVAVLGYGFWQHHFAGDPGVLGKSLVLDTKRYTIVGVAEPFRPDGEADVYTPLGQDTAPYLQGRRAHPVTTYARLRPGATIVQAQAELSLIGRNLARQYPETNRDRTFLAQPLRPDVGDVGSSLWLLLGAVTLVLLVACVNVASLLLARAVSREREVAMRAALGATRWRIVRQCLTESGVLALGGGLLGVVLAAVGIRPFIAMWPGSLPRSEEVVLDWRVLLFAVTASLVCGLIFGMAPALRAPVRNLELALRAGGRALAASSRLHGALVAAEIALAVVLLISAGMLGRTLLKLSSLNPGVRIENVLTARVALSPTVLPNPERTRAAWKSLMEDARSVPGVQAVATVDTVPMRRGNNPLGYWTSPAVPPESQQPNALANSVSPEYLKVMGIPLLAGRFFDEHDRIGSEPVVVIDEVMAQHAFGTQAPVGKRLWVPGMGTDPLRIVGVVGHVRYWGLAGDDRAEIRDQFYYPFDQVPDRWMRRWSELMSVAIRTRVPPLSVLAPLRQAVRGAAADQVLYSVRTVDQLVSDSLSRQRFLLLLFSIFAALALLLACIGIYGVLAYLTSRRVPEIGIRMALGAKTGDVVRLILRQSMTMILAGLAVGAVSALAAGRLLEKLVEGMQPMTVSTFAAMIPVLLAAALLASFLPARRASRVDPLKALRQE